MLQTVADLHAAIDDRFPDNTTAEITPADVRAVLHDFVDSLAHTSTIINIGGYTVPLYFTVPTPVYHKTAATIAVVIFFGLASVKLSINGGAYVTYTAAQLLNLAVPAASQLQWQASAYATGFNSGSLYLEFA